MALPYLAVLRKAMMSECVDVLRMVMVLLVWQE
jgi:hypothetical protein